MTDSTPIDTDSSITPEQKEELTMTTSIEIEASTTTQTKETSNMTTPTEKSETVSIFDLVASNEPTKSLQSISIKEDEQAVIPFTHTVTRIKTHYCEEPEIRGYVECSGSTCILCRSGKKSEDRALFPVYDPIAQTVSVLLMSLAQRPTSLFPQILNALGKADGKRRVLFLKKDKAYAYFVTSRELTETEDDGAAVIKKFMEDTAAGTVSLDGVVQRFTEAQLRAVPAIERRLRLKEVL